MPFQVIENLSNGLDDKSAHLLLLYYKIKLNL
jgi:hypothetical protein